MKNRKAKKGDIRTRDQTVTNSFRGGLGSTSNFHRERASKFGGNPAPSHPEKHANRIWVKPKGQASLETLQGRGAKSEGQNGRVDQKKKFGA